MFIFFDKIKFESIDKMSFNDIYIFKTQDSEEVLKYKHIGRDQY